ALGCGGLVDVLVRTRIGPFTLEDAVDLEGLSTESVLGLLRPGVEAVAGLPRMVLDRNQVMGIMAGRRLPAGPDVLRSHSQGSIALIDSDGDLVALAEPDLVGGWLHPRKVLMTQ